MIRLLFTVFVGKFSGLANITEPFAEIGSTFDEVTKSAMPLL